MKKIISVLLIVLNLGLFSPYVYATENDDTFSISYGGKILPLSEYNPSNGAIAFANNKTACKKAHKGGKCSNCKNYTFGGAIQCLGFAFYTQNALFGYHYQNSTQLNKDKFDIIKDFNSDTSNVSEYTKNFFANIKLGAHIRTKKGHSMIYAGSNDKHIWTYEANTDYRCSVHFRKRSWSEMFTYLKNNKINYIASPKSFLFNSTINNSTSSNSASKTIANGTYVIASRLNNDYVLDIDGASKESKANLQLWKANGTGAQTFKVSHYKDGYYQIINTNSGKALDVYNNDKTAGTNVWQYNTNNTDAQLWEIKDAGSGYYYIVGKGSGLYLDVEESKVNSGTNILVWTPHYGDNQKWKFIK